jgi:thymidylate synthase
MSKIDIEYLALCKKILGHGKTYENRNRNINRLQIPSYTFRHEFADGFPALSTKKLHWKGVVAELLWFLRGDNDIKFLNDNGINMWNKDAYNWHKKEGGLLTFEEFNSRGTGSVGQNYSVQWRNFNGNTDQIANIIRLAKDDIMSSRLKVSAWNASELNQTALPPCHTDFQIVGVPLDDNNFGFELHWAQRSTDVFLGLPFDIATYAALAKIIEKQIGYKALAIEGSLKCVHFYANQYDALNRLVNRDVNKHANCWLSMPSTVNADIDEVFKSYSISDFKLIDYTSDSALKVEMLAPKR